MPIQQVHAFLIHPGKGNEAGTELNGSTVPLSGKLFQLLQGIYQKSETECDIGITFSPTDGKQSNACRDLFVEYLSAPTIENARKIARRLESNTDGRSGLGLLFLITGKEGSDHKIVISRFPTDNAIYVDEDHKNLTVQFLERVFMKNKTSYKAVIYRHSSIESGFWNGKAIDRQMNNASGETSNYWIADFLLSEFTVTSAAGTRRLAVALKNAAKKATVDIKQEITAVATLARGLSGQKISIKEFADHFKLSKEAYNTILSELRNPNSAQERFSFDFSEFSSVVAYRSVELNNGGILTALSSSFDDVFRREEIAERQEVRFVTQGQIVNEKLKSANT